MRMTCGPAAFKVHMSLTHRLVQQANEVRSREPQEGNVTPVPGLVLLLQYELVPNPEFVSYYYQCAGPCVAMDPKYIYLECTLNT